MLKEMKDQEKKIFDVASAQIGELLIDEERTAQGITMSDELSDLGLNSLMLAQLLITLETEFGVDPFAGDLSVADVHTVGDLVSAYAGHLGAGAGS